jgi:hypothetical protein
MTARRVGWIVAGLLAAGLIVFPSRAAEEVKEGAINERMVAAAAKALAATQARFEVGRATPEEVYIWSRRVLEAKLYSPESLMKHLALMQELHERIAAKNKVGGEGGEARFMHASEYYVAEALHFAGH